MSRQAEGECDADRAYAMNKGYVMFSYLLECVRQGRCSDIDAVLPEYLSIIQLFIGNDLLLAHKSFQYMSPHIISAAIDSGMSRKSACGIYAKYIKKAQQASSVPVLLELCRQIFLDFTDCVAHAKEEYNFSPLVRLFRLYISEHLYQPLSVCNIAKELYVSREHLSRIYKQETGETIYDFIRRKKISEAKLLLQHTSLTLADIGQQLGYCSQSHFADNFRKETGMTPRQFRNKYTCQGASAPKLNPSVSYIQI